jgi:protein-tyrosine sulfotransferase
LSANNKVIFILGLMPRSGTNFLSNLLQLHPDCAPAVPVWEDFLIAHLDLLANYSDSVADEWYESWGVTDQTGTDLDISLGNGLARFLEARCAGTRVISKTPRVDNLDLFYRFFPEGRLLILVRDGRSIVESGAQSFGWSREAAMHSVAQAAQTITSFQQKYPAEEGRYRILRYEDLWQNTEAELQELFEFLELDSDHYDWQQALALPVIGSSELEARIEGSIHWDPVERSAEFDPMSRFADWSNATHYRYNSVTGPDLIPFGYEIKEVEEHTFLLRMRNLLLDATWGVKVLLRPLYHRLLKR